MTRVILTNKKTGQELPEAELMWKRALVSKDASAVEIRFDGASHANAFYLDEWDYREVRTFRNGDVLRRKDRDDAYVQYMYVVDTFERGGQWLKINSEGLTYVHVNPAALNNPEWELV